MPPGSFWPKLPLTSTVGGTKRELGCGDNQHKHLKVCWKILAQMVESSCNVEDPGSIPGLGRSAG